MRHYLHRMTINKEQQATFEYKSDGRVFKIKQGSETDMAVSPSGRYLYAHLFCLNTDESWNITSY